MDLENKLDFLARGRASRRYHTMEMLQYQRLDAHQWGVAMFTTILAPAAPADRKLRLLMAGMVHDLPEHKSGDVPAPFKRMFPEVRAAFNEFEANMLADYGYGEILTEADMRLLKLADCADGAAHCIVERAKGNLFAKEAFYNFWEYLTVELKLYNPNRTDNAGCEGGEPALRRWLARNWREANGGEW